MELFGVVYISRAARPVKPEALDQLLLVSRANNAMMGITGVLLYGDRRFFQYFEGSRVNVAQIYARIRESSLHTDLVELMNQPIPERLLRNCIMGFREVPTSLLQQLSQEQWARERPWLHDHSANSPGMQRLVKFFDESPGETPSAQ